MEAAPPTLRGAECCGLFQPAASMSGHTALTAAGFAHLLGHAMGVVTMSAEASSNVVEISPPTRLTKSTMPSIVSEGLRIAGDVFSDGDVQVDGRVDGSVRARNITVAATGTVVGNIVADEVVISGSAMGEIRARSVVLTRTAKVASSITQESISVEAGALVQGMVKRPELRGPQPNGKNDDNERLIGRLDSPDNESLAAARELISEHVAAAG